MTFVEQLNEALKTHDIIADHCIAYDPALDDYEERIHIVNARLVPKDSLKVKPKE